MKNEEIKEFLNERVKIFSNNKIVHSGTVLSYGKDFIKIKDRFGDVVLIAIDNIISIQKEEGE